MNRIAQSIKNRLSLRPPQADSLNILAELTDKLTLKKHTPCPSQEGNTLSSELEIIRSAFPTCVDFERNFPSICFSLATGVGKTRLMGAFVVYLYLTKGIKNFFILAPNITIYNKLIEDFSNSTSPKYVFQGIGEFVHRQPRIITGDTYNIIAQTTFFRSDVHINVFNISKINAETKGGKLPRIKRLSEYLGDSYFSYLSSLDDLVLLMDESHHYRADRGMQVINELNPILGLELTATPQIERSGGAIKFKNVVFEYSLAKAIQDGFVKEPAVATRKDFDPYQYSADELDRIKLEDGIRIHEDTKVALDIYGRDNKVKPVKPFVLVVAQDTTHASKLKHLIISNAFFEGNYADKVMEIHSNQSGEEKEENIEKLISLENPDNKIEIVIHVNMLKEGWDVTNLYTIIPLRTATSMTLREQTIGRGLRLPYGKRTCVDKVDKLTIVAHDKFQEIIDAANQPDSIIKRQNIIEIPRITIQQSNEVRSGFKDFDLDTRNLNYQPVSEEILIKKLRVQENSVDIISGKGRGIHDSPENIIVNEFINYSEIDYDEQSDLLFRLTRQAIEKFRTYLDDDKLMNVVQYNKKEIGSYIYSQLMQHFYFEAPSYEKPMVKPFTRIEEHNFSKYTKDSIHHFTETIIPTNAIPNKVFSGFKKACHNLYKFDSKTEKDFVVILEQDRTVLKWLRPASNQFHIYWKHNSRQYNPDFVVETKDAIYLIETKKEMDIESSDVQEKAQAALEYCKYATDFTIPNGGKPWKYVLIPHNAVMVNMSFETLVKSNEYQS